MSGAPRVGHAGKGNEQSKKVVPLTPTSRRNRVRHPLIPVAHTPEIRLKMPAEPPPGHVV